MLEESLALLENLRRVIDSGALFINKIMNLVSAEVILCHLMKIHGVTITFLQPLNSRLLFPKKLMLESFGGVFLLKIYLQSVKEIGGLIAGTPLDTQKTFLQSF